MGKTAFVLNIAQYMAFKSGVTTAIFSLEMSKEQLVNRLLSLESKVDSQSIRTGNLAVSYTHLEVYKRQVMCGSANISVRMRTRYSS